MKFETYMLRGLFVACFAVCALILGAMLNAKPPAARLTAIGSNLTSILLTAPTNCRLPSDGVVCPQLPG